MIHFYTDKQKKPQCSIRLIDLATVSFLDDLNQENIQVTLEFSQQILLLNVYLIRPESLQ